MLKKVLASFGLLLGLALFATEATAQCGPNQVLFVNQSPCAKTVVVNFGNPCTVMGSTAGVVVNPGAFVCVAVPMPFVPISYTVTDNGTGLGNTVTDPMCGGAQMGMHRACFSVCNLVQWTSPWHIDILDD